jgi:hypothetical protein
MSDHSELHARHDPLLVASLAAGDLVGVEREQATAQIAGCADCAALHADLIDIARATAALPPAVAPRDFTLSPAQAAALRPIGWRRLIAAIGASRPLMSRQLGIGLATIGLAGLLVSTLPGIPTAGQGAAAPAAAMPASATDSGETPTDLGTQAGGPVTVAGEGASSAPALAPTTTGSTDRSITTLPSPSRSSGDAMGVFGGNQGHSPAPGRTSTAQSYDAAASPPPETSRLAPPNAAAGEPPAPTDGGRALLVAGSALLLAAGIALLLIRRLARRPAWG